MGKIITKYLSDEQYVDTGRGRLPIPGYVLAVRTREEGWITGSALRAIDFADHRIQAQLRAAREIDRDPRLWVSPND